MSEKLPPIHPGQVLKHSFLEDMGISEYRLAKELGIPRDRISRIVRGQQGISADTALRLERFFGLSDGYWMRMQADYEREVERDRIEAQLAAIKPWQAA